MQSQLFILAITCYLISLVATLTGSFFFKLIPSKIITLLIVFHFLVLAAWLILNFTTDNVTDSKTGNLFFLAAFCLGIIVSGIILRSGFPVYLKIYFSLFLLSVPVFVVSPSRVLGFIVSGNFNTVNPKRFHVSENYFFIEQQSAGTENNDTLYYKLVREMGMFHSTLARNVALPTGTDSVKKMGSMDSDDLKFLVYFHNDSKSDSFELQVRKDIKYKPGQLKQVRNH